ncbi:MAG: phosphotransferase [Lachnospiraceae bacterium]|nr:phosphotransferase [Lachnospiraceae bacterium]
MIEGKFHIERAIIMAAGKGERLRPATETTPKPLLKVNGVRMLDGLIENLRNNGIKEIHVVVGYKKEQFIEWNKDYPEIDIIINPYYETANNISSLYVARDFLENAMILDGDQIVSDSSILHPDFDISGYSAALIDGYSDEWILTVDGGIITECSRDGGTAGWRLFSVSRWNREDGRLLRQLVEREFANKHNTDIYWDDIAMFCYPDLFQLGIDPVRAGGIIEIDTYDELLQYDHSYSSEGTVSYLELPENALIVASEALGVGTESINDISVMKKGMTNRTYTFSCKNDRYIIRIPGEGTDKLIDRNKEVAVYKAIKNKGYCDDVIYINSNNGYKITRFLSSTRVCDANSIPDLRKCMDLLRKLHEDSVHVDYEFDIFERISFYEELWNGEPSVYKDYLSTKQHVYELKDYIEAQVEKKCLAHIDSVPDNFLFYVDADGTERLQLIDWEYAGVQDPHVDIAMFCIYSLYDRSETDRLIDIYFEGDCAPETRIKIYCYMSVCGLLWSNWCEYKRILGVEFGEYSIAQYNYAKDYYTLAKTMMEK